MASGLKFKVIVEKVIDHCWHECPYFSTESSLMFCNHPQLEKDGLRGYETCIIYHPTCKTGFPNKCPLRKLPSASA